MDATEIRRLTELAARATGFVIRQDIPTGPGVWGYRADDQHKNLTGWKPAHDDGDAMRLAAALGLDIHHREVVWASLAGRGIQFSEPYGNDRTAATRLAVLRAAAEVGEQMETNP